MSFIRNVTLALMAGILLLIGVAIWSTRTCACIPAEVTDKDHGSGREERDEAIRKAYEQAKRLNSLGAWEQFAFNYPDAPSFEEALDRIREIKLQIQAAAEGKDVQAQAPAPADEPKQEPAPSVSSPKEEAAKPAVEASTKTPPQDPAAAADAGQAADAPKAAAKKTAEELFDEAQRTGTVEAYDVFLKAYPYHALSALAWSERERAAVAGQ